MQQLQQPKEKEVKIVKSDYDRLKQIEYLINSGQLQVPTELLAANNPAQGGDRQGEQVIPAQGVSAGPRVSPQ